ncbi:PLP-dependent aminotransferase family protein [Vibrio sp.]|nr:PLP-dependent aminotransferase family protein [Vibrio sp.]
MIIDIGDLALTEQGQTKQEKLFNAIRAKIVSGLWHSNAKLPSTRELAARMGLGRNTVVATYEQLVAEGYLKSHVGSGFFVAVSLPEQFYVGESVQQTNSAEDTNEHSLRSFSPGVPDLEVFPIKRWSQMIHQQGQRRAYLGYNDLQGLRVLRDAIAHYVSSSRTVYCSPEQVIITHGAQQAISIALLATANFGGDVIFEEPGYGNVRAVLDLFNMNNIPFPIDKQSGWDFSSLKNATAKTVYVTPSNQYPLGLSMPVAERLELLEWAALNQSVIIEDDYDSEFQFAHQPYPSLQGLAHEFGYSDNVIYIGSLSKVMFNSMRLGYMVVPPSMVEKCCSIKQTLGGELAAASQLALAQFLNEGHLQRHIRKMRRIYQDKHQAMVAAIEAHFNGDIEIVSQAAGLHVTIVWHSKVCENRLSDLAKTHQLKVRAISAYESYAPNRDWQGAVLGFGNADINRIDMDIKHLADLFYQLLEEKD